MQLFGRVTTHMTGININRAPQPCVLWNRQQHDSAWLQCIVHLDEHLLVFFDVFQHIKGSDGFKLIYKWNIPGIHLHQIDGWLSRGSESQPKCKYFTTV